MQMYKMLTCSSNCWTTCIWTRHCAVLLSSSTCSLFKCLQKYIFELMKNSTIFKEKRALDDGRHSSFHTDVIFTPPPCTSNVCLRSADLWPLCTDTILALDTWNSLHSLEKCLKISKDGLTAGPFTHPISIQRVTVLCVLIQKATKHRQNPAINGSVNYPVLLQHNKPACEASTRNTINSWSTCPSSWEDVGCHWRCTAGWKTLWHRRQRTTSCHFHSLKLQRKCSGWRFSPA